MFYLGSNFLCFDKDKLEEAVTSGNKIEEANLQEQIKLLDDTGKKQYLFGFEESCGYLRGTHARDKDAVVSSLLILNSDLITCNKSENLTIDICLEDNKV